MTAIKIRTAETEPSTAIELVLRRLTTRDVFTVMTLLTDSIGSADDVKKLFTDVKDAAGKKSYDKKPDDVFGGPAPEDDEGDSFVAVGITSIWGLLTGLLHERTFVDWLANLVGKTTEDFEKLPPMVVIEVLAALRNHPDITDFFERLSGALALLDEEPESSTGLEQPELTSEEPSTKSNDDTVGPTA